MTQTAAEKYAELKQKRIEEWLAQSFSKEALKDIPLFEVKCPSGQVFKCRRPDMEYFQAMGQMPMVLSGAMVEAMDGAKSAEQQLEDFKKMSPEERRANIQATALMIRYITVEPRLIVGAVNGHKNAISVDMLTQDDFKTLANWGSDGGGAADSLKTFRTKRK